MFYNPFLQTWDIDCAIIEPLAKFEPQKTFEPTDEDPDLEVINCVSYFGYKRYELTNHLGNVLVTVSDKKFFDTDATTPGLRAEVHTAQDYYPFGMTMPGRVGSLRITGSDPDCGSTCTVEFKLEAQYAGTEALSAYRFGFNGKEADTEWHTDVNYDYGFRIYDPRISRFLSVDPLTKDYPYLSPYPFAENQPIWAIDLDGLEATIVIHSPDLTKKIHQSFNQKNAVILWKRIGYAYGLKFPDSYAKRKLGNLIPDGRRVSTFSNERKEGTILIYGTRWKDPKDHNKGGEVYLIGEFAVTNYHEQEKGWIDNIKDFLSSLGGTYRDEYGTKEKDQNYGFTFTSSELLGEINPLGPNSEVLGNPINIDEFLGPRGGADANGISIIAFSKVRELFDAGVAVADAKEKLSQENKVEKKPIIMIRSDTSRRNGYKVITNTFSNDSVHTETDYTSPDK